jgi:phosphatidylglycerophosphatase A
MFLATGAGSGYAPIAPGTAGTLVGLALGYFVLAPLWRVHPLEFALCFAIAFAGGCGVAGAAERILGEHDSSKIVLDEIFGMVAAMFMNPTGALWVGAGFAIFRFFDILKPFPANYFDRRVGGGAGVMLDDLAAGIYANLVLQAARRLL